MRDGNRSRTADSDSASRLGEQPVATRIGGSSYSRPAKSRPQQAAAAGALMGGPATPLPGKTVAEDDDQAPEPSLD